METINDATVPTPVPLPQMATIRKLTEPVGIIKEAIQKQTKDLYLAAAFHCEGCRYEKVDKTDRTRMIFVFEGGELADRVEKDWYAQNLVVSATSYAASLRMMKSVIHS